MSRMNDRRRSAPASERNREPIREVLVRELPASGDVLEIASGTGVHAVWFARAFPGLRWQPTDLSQIALDSIAAWREREGLDNLAEPLRLDVTAPWPVERVDAIFNANMIHISPFECAEALIAGAGRALSPGGPLIVYGPFKIDGAHTAESNARFDQSLRSRDPRWGVRDLEAIVALAEAVGLTLTARHEMPANNQTLVLRKDA